MTNENLKNQIDALQFAQTDLLLYLDVHPADSAARTQWEKNAAALAALQREHMDLTGMAWPLTQALHGGTCAWVAAPWPWDNQR